MSVKTMHDFISRYYSRKEGETCERKSFVRFRDAMPATMDANAIENAYTAFSGKSPRYVKTACGTLSDYDREEYARKACTIADSLTHDPTSFTDLYNKAGLNPFGYSHAPMHGTTSIRKCFKRAADAGIIGCVEIKTCGKCAIRLYYLND